MACALARLHARQGRKVRVFKCGPDFLDPHWLALASGAPVYQLDLWMTGEADCAQRLHDAALEADLSIVEGALPGAMIAVARDAAFYFIYAANIDCLHAMGAQTVYFHCWPTPRFPRVMRRGCPAVTASSRPGAGRPHQHASRHHLACAGRQARVGRMRRHDGAVRCVGDSRWPGTLHVGCVAWQHHAAKAAGCVGPQQLAVHGGVLRGHAFRYSNCATDLPSHTRTEAAPGHLLCGEGKALLQQGSVQAPYFHAWLVSDPAAAAQLFLNAIHD